MADLGPTSPGEWWPAIGAMVTAVTLLCAAMSAKLAAQAVEVEQNVLA